MVHAHKERKQDTRDALYAKTGFWLSLGFWIPLFNIALCAVALVFSVMALRAHARDPSSYGGFGYAVAGLVISCAGIALTIFGVILWLTSKSICSSALCTVAVAG